jgi:phage terminase small subunit
VRGRKPSATRLKALGGTRPSRLNGSGPPRQPGRPEPPGRYDAPTRARWGELCNALEGMGILSPRYAPALEVYCDAYAVALAAEADVLTRPRAGAGGSTCRRPRRGRGRTSSRTSGSRFWPSGPRGAPVGIE